VTAIWQHMHETASQVPTISEGHELKRFHHSSYASGNPGQLFGLATNANSCRRLALIHACEVGAAQFDLSVESSSPRVRESVNPRVQESWGLKPAPHILRSSAVSCIVVCMQIRCGGGGNDSWASSQAAVPDDPET
jgi:hypothetical protein